MGEARSGFTKRLRLKTGRRQRKHGLGWNSGPLAAGQVSSYVGGELKEGQWINVWRRDTDSSQRFYLTPGEVGRPHLPKMFCVHVHQSIALDDKGQSTRETRGRNTALTDSSARQRGLRSHSRQSARC